MPSFLRRLRLRDHPGPPPLNASLPPPSSLPLNLRLDSSLHPTPAGKITPSRPPPPRPIITYDKGLPSLPDDIICEIFVLLDTEALKSCSLTGKALSCLAKPFLHQTLNLTRRFEAPPEFNIPGRWNELEGLPILGERGLLQYTRHLSIILPHDPLFARCLETHIQHLHTLTNLTNFKTRWLDTPSFIPKMEDYFGAFLGTLQSLELEFPRGDHKQIFYYICQFPNLRDLKINSVKGYTNSMRNDGPRPDIKTSPPLDGTLGLHFGVNTGLESDSMGTQLILSNIIALPSGLRFRTLKLSGCAGNNLQPLVDACAQTLERMELTGERFGASFFAGKTSPVHLCHTIPLSGAPKDPQLSFKRHPAFRKLEINLTKRENTKSTARWLSETLSTVTSNVFTELTIHVPPFYTADEDRVRAWNSVDKVLDRLSQCEGVTLVVKLQYWVEEDAMFQAQFETNFPLMWKNGRATLDIPPPDMEDELLRGVPLYYWLAAER